MPPNSPNQIVSNVQRGQPIGAGALMSKPPSVPGTVEAELEYLSEAVRDLAGIQNEIRLRLSPIIAEVGLASAVNHPTGSNAAEDTDPACELASRIQSERKSVQAHVFALRDMLSEIRL